MINQQTAPQIRAAYMRTKKANRAAFSIERTWIMANDPRTWILGAELTMARLKQGKPASITWADVRNLLEKKGARAVLKTNLLDQYASESPRRLGWVQFWIPDWIPRSERPLSQKAIDRRIRKAAEKGMVAHSFQELGATLLAAA